LTLPGSGFSAQEDCIWLGGFGMTALGSGDIIVVPIRPGVGLRLGANLGYLNAAGDLESVLILPPAAVLLDPSQSGAACQMAVN
jgi:hypothetical protein